MGISDFVMASLILGGSAYLLYRSVWKKKGHCSGCTSGGCGRGDMVVLRARRPVEDAVCDRRPGDEPPTSAKLMP